MKRVVVLVLLLLCLPRAAFAMKVGSKRFPESAILAEIVV